MRRHKLWLVSNMLPLVRQMSISFIWEAKCRPHFLSLNNSVSGLRAVALLSHPNTPGLHRRVRKQLNSATLFVSVGLPGGSSTTCATKISHVSRLTGYFNISRGLVMSRPCPAPYHQRREGQSLCPPVGFFENPWIITLCHNVENEILFSFAIIHPLS